MANRNLTTRQRQKYDTADNWAKNNPVLLAGEIGVESDTNKMKVGNGTGKWSNLSYSGGNDVTLYDTTGQNTDGSMTQKATTDELAKKVGYTDTIDTTGTKNVTLKDANNETLYPTTKADNVYNDDGTTVSESFAALESLRPKILWTNADPSSKFESQTITIDNLSNYNRLDISYYGNRSDKDLITHIIYFDDTGTTFLHRADIGYADSDGDSIVTHSREITISENTITFSDCTTKFWKGGVVKYNQTRNQNQVPIKIIGYKIGE
jgi:hypothetical protein